MNRSECIKDLAAALAKAQAQIKSAPKDSLNPHFKSKYADLASAWDSCRAALSANGLSVSQHPSTDGAKVELTTILMHTSDQWLSSTFAITAQQNTPQGIGSALTYARRYALMAIVGIAADDDDGELATRGEKPSEKKHDSAKAQKAKLAIDFANALKAFQALGKKESDLLAYVNEVFGPTKKENLTAEHMDSLRLWYEELLHEGEAQK